jgi:hypothetical protein
MSTTVRVEMAPDWRERLREAEFAFLDEHLGPDILTDAQRLVPIDTGRLLRSLAHQVIAVDTGWALHVGSYADEDGEVEYAAAVELGFHGEEFVREYINRDFMGSGREVVIHAHVRRGNVPEQPYLRPSLYTERY